MAEVNETQEWENSRQGGGPGPVGADHVATKGANDVWGAVGSQDRTDPAGDERGARGGDRWDVPTPIDLVDENMYRDYQMLIEQNGEV